MKSSCSMISSKVDSSGSCSMTLIAFCFTLCILKQYFKKWEKGRVRIANLLPNCPGTVKLITCFCAIFPALSTFCCTHRELGQYNGIIRTTVTISRFSLTVASDIQTCGLVSYYDRICRVSCPEHPVGRLLRGLANPRVIRRRSHWQTYAL